IRQSMAESLLLAIAGGSAGVLIMIWITPFLERLTPRAMEGWSEPQLDWRLLLFSLLITTGAALAAGALPSLAIAGIDLNEALQSGGRSGIGGRARARSALVIAEVAIAVILTIGAGLMVETFRRLSRVELGFRPDGLLTMRTSLPASAESPYRTFAARAAFYERVLERVRSIPGVTAAGYTTFLPLTNDGGTSGFVIESAPPLPAGKANDANHRVISAEYLQTMGI